MKYHDNVVKLNLKKGELYEIDGKFGYFKVTELCITSGQDPDKKNKVGNVYPINANGEIVFRVGRKGSSTVANWWKERIPANHTTFNHDPGDLNFAFIGELVLYVASIKKVVTYKNVGLAQGHAGASNNWWFGGKEMCYIGNHNVLGKDIDGSTNLIGLRGDNIVNEIYLQIYISWMSQLSDDTLLSELSIPGTHDSGTSRLIPPVDAGPAHCQNFDIVQQLRDGIRFFDIRLGKDMSLWHGCIQCDVKWDDVIQQMNDFLRTNANEFIVMLVGCECDEWTYEMKGGVDKYRNLYIQDFDTLSLQVKDARGKIVLLKRQKECPCGKFLRFSNNTTFDYDGFRVEDVYDEHDTHKKLEVVKKNLESAKTNSTRYFHITFNSVSQGTHTPYQYACGGLGVDPAMNIALADYLAKNPGKHMWGAILLDFYNDEGNSPQPVKDIINSNFDTPLLK